MHRIHTLEIINSHIVFIQSFTGIRDLVCLRISLRIELYFRENLRMIPDVKLRLVFEEDILSIIQFLRIF